MLNMDFSRRLAIETDGMKWSGSPISGVSRKLLEREAKESGHATSIVKYEAGSSFSEHAHPLGEEIFVLEGVFSDETGNFGSGTYIRNPPGSCHTPFSKEGCVIWVKLNQFSVNDTDQVRIDTSSLSWQSGMGGLQVMALHEFEHEHVALVKWPENERFQLHRHFGGEEIVVLSGEFRDEYGIYPKHTWIRSPHMSQHQPCVKEAAVILVKTCHLRIG